MLAPTIEEIAEEYEGRLTVGKLNVDDHGEIAARFSIRGIPTILRDPTSAGGSCPALPRPISRSSAAQMFRR